VGRIVDIDAGHATEHCGVLVILALLGLAANFEQLLALGCELEHLSIIHAGTADPDVAFLVD